MSDDFNFDNEEGSINSIPTEVRVIKTTNVSRGEDIEKMLSQIINMNSENVIHEPTCPICSSSCRKDIENKYIEKKGNLEEAKTLYKSRTGNDLDLYFFKNHFDLHIGQGLKELQKIEYTQKIKRLYNQSLTTLDRIDMVTAILMERIIGVNSLSPSTNESDAQIEKTKSSETSRLMGVYTNLIKLRASICGEMKSNGEIITLPAKEFVEVFIEAIQSAKTEKEKQGFKSLLDRLESLSRKTQI